MLVRCWWLGPGGPRLPVPLVGDRRQALDDHMKIEIEADEKDLRNVADRWGISIPNGTGPLGRVAEAIKEALPEETVTIEVPLSAAEGMASGKLLDRFVAGEWTGNQHYDALRAACQKALGPRPVW